MLWFIPKTETLRPLGRSEGQVAQSSRCASRNAATLALILFQGFLRPDSQDDSVSRPTLSIRAISRRRMALAPRQGRRRLPTVLVTVSSGSYPTKAMTLASTSYSGVLAALPRPRQEQRVGTNGPC